MDPTYAHSAARSSQADAGNVARIRRFIARRAWDLPLWAQAVTLLSVVKLSGATALLLGGSRATSHAPARFPILIYVAEVVGFSLVACLLLVGGRRDRRAAVLGGFFLLVALSFADVLLLQAGGDLALSRMLLAVRLEPFLPAFLWTFTREFPEPVTFGPVERATRLALGASLFVGVALFAVNTFHDLSLVGWTEAIAPAWLLRSRADSLYWPLLFALMLPAAPALLARTTSPRAADRRRVALFLWGLVLGLTPICLDVLLSAVLPPYRRLTQGPLSTHVSAALVLLPLMLVPVVTAYSVLVNRVLDARLIVRRALQYALARYCSFVLFLAPAAALAIFLYWQREYPIGALIAGGQGVALVALTIGGALVASSRQRLMKSIDRRFFRDAYDSRQILTQLVEKSRRTEDVHALSALLVDELDQALHLEHVAMMLLDRRSGLFTSPDGRVRPLPRSSTFAELLARDDAPMDIDVTNPHSPLHRLHEEDRLWLGDGGFRLAVPMRGSSGQLLGLLALGDKRSELPFTAEDRALLGAVAAAGVLALERLRVPGLADGLPTPDALGRDGAPALEDRAAFECVPCGEVTSDAAIAGLKVCACGGHLVVCPLPLLLNGKFRLERRIGRGGMGLVYRAVDLTLGRAVAIKTLPLVQPRHTNDLRREARAMAAASHPGLLVIHEVTAWRGVPVLIVEYLAGGTLADRLRSGPQPLADVVDMGVALTDALSHLHARGLLHGDIKPSNIGFTLQGTPKLLDFGLSRLLGRARAMHPDSTTRAGGEEDLPIVNVLGSTLDADGRSHIGAGTPAYMSPEAILQERDSPAFDLWSLAVVLFEALAGEHPFRRDTVAETFATIHASAGVELRRYRPDAPNQLVELFRDALSPHSHSRPRSSAAFRHRLVTVRDDVRRSEFQSTWNPS